MPETPYYREDLAWVHHTGYAGYVENAQRGIVDQQETLFVRELRRMADVLGSRAVGLGFQVGVGTPVLRVGDVEGQPRRIGAVDGRVAAHRAGEAADQELARLDHAIEECIATTAGERAPSLPDVRVWVSLTDEGRPPASARF